MPQGSKLDENGKVIWPYDICCEFDCGIDYAMKNGADCKGDFTKKPCLFLGEHKYLNLEIQGMTSEQAYEEGQGK